jgi:hypothetical protein
MVTQFRRALDEPRLPFIAGELGSFLRERGGEHPHCDEVNHAIKAMTREASPAAFVSSSGLTHGGDHLHFDAESLRELGIRYAVPFRQMEVAN